MFSTILTTLGQAKIAAALANGTTVNLATVSIGDGAGNPVTPNENQTSLVRKVASFPINDSKATGNTILIETVLPPEVGGYTIREYGITDDAGDLIAIGNTPDTYKPLPADGASTQLILRGYITVSNAAAITITTDPNTAVATRDWVKNNYNLTILLPGGTTGQIARKRSNNDGDIEWVDPLTNTNITVATITEEQTLAANQTVVTLAIATTANSAIYINGLRIPPTQITITSPTTLTLAQAYPTNSKILIAQNDPQSGAGYLQTSNRLSEIAAAGATAQNDARENLGLPAVLKALKQETLDAVPAPPAIPIASTTQRGLMQVGDGMTVDKNGVGSVPKADADIPNLSDERVVGTIKIPGVAAGVTLIKEVYEITLFDNTPGPGVNTQKPILFPVAFTTILSCHGWTQNKDNPTGGVPVPYTSLDNSYSLQLTYAATPTPRFLLSNGSSSNNRASWDITYLTVRYLKN